MMDGRRDETGDDEVGNDGTRNGEDSGNGAFQLHDGAFPADLSQF